MIHRVNYSLTPERLVRDKAALQEADLISKGLPQPKLEYEQLYTLTVSVILLLNFKKEEN